MRAHSRNIVIDVGQRILSIGEVVLHDLVDTNLGHAFWASPLLVSALRSTPPNLYALRRHAHLGYPIWSVALPFTTYEYLIRAPFPIAVSVLVISAIPNNRRASFP